MRVISIIIVILILIGYYLYTVKKSFKVSFKIDDIALKDFNAQSFNAGQSFIQTRILFVVWYQALIRIIISNLYLEVYYENVLVAKSSDIAENFKKLTLLPNVNNLVYQTFDLKINASSIKLAALIKTNQHYSVNYKLSAKVFGIQLNFNNIYSV